MKCPYCRKRMRSYKQDGCRWHECPSCIRESCQGKEHVRKSIVKKNTAFLKFCKEETFGTVPCNTVADLNNPADVEYIVKKFNAALIKSSGIPPELLGLCPKCKQGRDKCECYKEYDR